MPYSQKNFRISRWKHFLYWKYLFASCFNEKIRKEIKFIGNWDDSANFKALKLVFVCTRCRDSQPGMFMSRRTLYKYVKWEHLYIDVRRLFSRGAKNILFAKKHQKYTIILEKSRKTYYLGQPEGDKGPLLPSPADAHAFIAHRKRWKASRLRNNNIKSNSDITKTTRLSIFVYCNRNIAITVKIYAII